MDNNSSLIVEIQLLNKNAIIPQKMSEQAAGYDVFAYLERDITIKPLSRALIPTGFAMALPAGYEAQIRPRSGLAVKHGLTVLNSPGTIDADYRGEVKIVLINLSENEFVITNGMRIAQMIITKHESINFKKVEILDTTIRGEGGFGHTSF